MSKTKAKTTHAKPTKKTATDIVADALSEVVNHSDGDNVDDTADSFAYSLDEVVKAAVQEAAEKETHSEKTHEAMGPYKDAYPEAKHFFLTSDGQVFLPTSESDAKLHQRIVDDKKELVKYSV